MTKRMLNEELNTENPDILNLLQADGSQEEILKEARYKKGLVVHGPPGTGKSQVIVNLITDALTTRKENISCMSKEGCIRCCVSTA